MIDFHTVYERHAADLHRFALYLTGNPALADDLVADAFVRLWTASGGIRTDTVRAYLIAIDRKLSRNSRRRGARDVPRADTHVVADVAAPARAARELCAACLWWIYYRQSQAFRRAGWGR